MQLVLNIEVTELMLLTNEDKIEYLLTIIQKEKMSENFLAFINDFFLVADTQVVDVNFDNARCSKFQ